ncbi:N-6 DNA methylase [Actinoallomurus spadix]|uniref:N-6 DNA methylase n=1 Tax=Actinoallomurus spadix TaxID=79912 RepID=A0ABN0WI55_9ACTN|nr:N-6 DNA methylase [Actinoallomurus spadix]MCO5989925.1 N-6 DNA methylase [Actinoallomurus spadix]
MREPITVTAADIARLTGYGRAAVSNWRRRHDDFPQPVGGTANSPLFALAEVEKWLAAQGKAMEVSPEEHLWQLIRTVADDLQLAAVIADLGTGLTGEARAHDKALAALREETAAVAERLGPADTFEFLVDRYVEAHSRRVLNTPAETAALMAELAEIDGGSVLDPACGIGTLLLAALEHRPARILAQDRDEATAVITRIRLAMRGTPAALAVGDALRANGFPGERVDVVLCDPPFGDRAWGYDELTSDPRWTYGLPPRGESELAWVEHALWQLNPGGRAVVLMPSAAADRRSGRRIRAQLLRAGVLRAVIELPAGFASASAAPPHLWLLRRPAPDDPLPGHILKMNAASLDPREVRPAVVTRWRAFLERPDDPQMSELSQAVPVVDLLDDVVDLTSTRHLTPPAAGEADYANARERLQASLTAANDAASALIPLLTEPEEVPMTTVSELIQSGAVSVRQSPVKMATDAGDLPMLTVKDVLVDRPPSGRTTDGPGVVILRRGDVVVPPATGRIEVAVVQADGAAAGPHLQVFRTDPERCDPYFLACFLRAAGLSRAGTTASRTDARRVPIPRLPLERQRPYGAAFQRLQALSAALRNLGDVGESLITLGFEGLAAGAMKPGS